MEKLLKEEINYIAYLIMEQARRGDKKAKDLVDRLGVDISRKETHPHGSCRSGVDNCYNVTQV